MLQRIIGGGRTGVAFCGVETTGIEPANYGLQCDIGEGLKAWRTPCQ